MRSEVFGRHVGRGPDHGAVVGALDDRVAPLERRRRRERAEPGECVSELARRPVAAGASSVRVARSRSAVTSVARVSTMVCGRASDGRDRIRSQPVLLPVEQAAQRPVEARPGLPDQPHLIGEVGDDPLGRVGRGRGPHVGHVVDQRHVGLVPDRGHDRRAAGEHRPAQRLVGERQQVLGRTAAPREHDDVDRLVAVEHGERVDDLRHGDRALHRHVDHPELDRRPAASRVHQHVALGRAGPAGDQPDLAGQERQPSLAGPVEQSLGGQQLLELLEPGQQLTEADLANLVGPQAQGAASGVELRLGVHDHARAVAQVGRAEVEHVAVGRHGQAEIGRRVAQGEEHRGVARAAADLGDLAVDPHPAELGHPGADLLADDAHGPGLLGTRRRLNGHVDTLGGATDTFRRAGRMRRRRPEQL